MNFHHYELDVKWAQAGALVFGRRVKVRKTELKDLYQRHYENDQIAFFIAVWPLGEGEGERVPSVVGSGDLYHRLEDGQDRYGKFALYALKDLRREEAGLADYFDDCPNAEAAEVDDLQSQWWLVQGRGKQAVAVYFGVTIKPGEVPSPLPPGLEAFRAHGPGGRAHPRTIVGVRLADTLDTNLTAFDPADPRVAAAKRALAAALPKHKNPGFGVVPCAVAPPLNTSAVSAIEDTLPEEAFLSRISRRFGRLESDGGRYFSRSMRGVVVRVEGQVSDVFAAWNATPDFAFGDRAARYRMWHGERATLVDVEIDTIDGGLARRWLGLAELGDWSLLLILEHADEAEAKELLGVAADAVAEQGEITLGHG